MINNITKKFTLRKGFISGVFFLLLFNTIFVALYYKFYFSDIILIKYNEIEVELNDNINEINKKITNVNSINNYLEKYSKNNNVSIIIKDNESNILYSYTNISKKKNAKDKISVSNLIEIDGKTAMITLSKERDKYVSKIVNDLINFEFIIIFLLTTTGLFGVNTKLLAPIVELSNDINNYKLGILPKKKKIRNGIDELQNEFVNLVDTLEEEKKNQNRIIASISHDIKTPLTSILGYSDMIVNNEKIDINKKKKYAKTIYNKSLEMKEIIEEFDDYLACNIKENTKLEKITIKYLISYLNNYYKEDLKEKNIEFKIRSNCQNSAIFVDLSKFKRIFANTITNSIRYLKNEKKLIIITINREKHDKIVIEIADNGTGTKEDLNKIFEPLYTTDKSRKLGGLGLSICKEIVESHNGTIEAINNKYKGFSIIITIDEYKE